MITIHEFIISNGKISYGDDPYIGRRMSLANQQALWLAIEPCLKAPINPQEEVDEFWKKYQQSTITA